MRRLLAQCGGAGVLVVLVVLLVLLVVLVVLVVLAVLAVLVVLVRAGIQQPYFRVGIEAGCCHRVCTKDLPNRDLITQAACLRLHHFAHDHGCKTGFASA